MTLDLVWANENDKEYSERSCGANFSFAWGAMRWLIPAMTELGMVFDASYDWHAAWPKQDGITDDDWDEEDPARRSPARVQYEASVKQVVERRFEHPGIPLHKFDSNDPWRIWPDEISSALQRYAERHPAHEWAEEWQRETFGRFAAYLLFAVEHGGVIVH